MAVFGCTSCGWKYEHHVTQIYKKTLLLRLDHCNKCEKLRNFQFVSHSGIIGRRTGTPAGIPGPSVATMYFRKARNGLEALAPLKAASNSVTRFKVEYAALKQMLKRETNPRRRKALEAQAVQARYQVLRGMGWSRARITRLERLIIDEKKRTPTTSNEQAEATLPRDTHVVPIHISAARHALLVQGVCELYWNPEMILELREQLSDFGLGAGALTSADPNRFTTEELGQLDLAGSLARQLHLDKGVISEKTTPLSSIKSNTQQLVKVYNHGRIARLLIRARRDVEKYWETPSPVVVKILRSRMLTRNEPTDGTGDELTEQEKQILARSKEKLSLRARLAFYAWRASEKIKSGVTSFSDEDFPEDTRSFALNHHLTNRTVKLYRPLLTLLMPRTPKRLRRKRKESKRPPAKQDSATQ